MLKRIVQFVFVYLFLVLCLFAYGKRVHKMDSLNVANNNYYQSSLVNNY